MRPFTTLHFTICYLDTCHFIAPAMNYLTFHHYDISLPHKGKFCEECVLNLSYLENICREVFETALLKPVY